MIPKIGNSEILDDNSDRTVFGTKNEKILNKCKLV